VNGPEHYESAEQLLAACRDGTRSVYGTTPNELAAALVHAVLALTAATVDGSEGIRQLASDAWTDVGTTVWTKPGQP
jgi:hypothetical protein